MIIYFAGVPGGVWKEVDASLAEMRIPRLISFYYKERNKSILEAIKNLEDIPGSSGQSSSPEKDTK
jgi:hypothetical protein